METASEENPLTATPAPLGWETQLARRLAHTQQPELQPPPSSPQSSRAGRPRPPRPKPANRRRERQSAPKPTPLMARAPRPSSPSSAWRPGRGSGLRLGSLQVLLPPGRLPEDAAAGLAPSRPGDTAVRGGARLFPRFPPALGLTHHRAPRPASCKSGTSPRHRAGPNGAGTTRTCGLTRQPGR